jgi:hypothetical protein
VHQEYGREIGLPRSLPELRDVAPAEGSSEVPQENDQAGPAGEILAQGFPVQVATEDGLREELCGKGAWMVFVHDGVRWEPKGWEG